MGEEADKVKLGCGRLIPGCDAVFTGSSEEDVLEQVAAHARGEHGIDSIDEDLAERMRSEIKQVD